jgi:hypothetical protein
MILEGKSAEEIAALWHDDLESFKAERKQYLIYRKNNDKHYEKQIVI